MTNSLIDDFFNDLNQFLLNFGDTNGLEKVLSDYKPIMSRENGSKSRGDLSLNFVSPKFNLWHKHLPQLFDQLVSQSKQWQTLSIDSFKILTNRRVLLFVCRPTALPKLIHQFSRVLNQNVNKISDNCLVVGYEFNLNNQFSIERHRKVSHSVSKLMSISCIDHKHNLTSDEDIAQILSLAETSIHYESNIYNKLLFRIKPKDNKQGYEEECISIDKNCRISFELIDNLHHLVKDNVKSDTNSSIVFVIPESLSYKMSQSFRLMCLLYNFNINFKLIPVSHVNCNLDYDAYVQNIRDKLLEQNDNSFGTTDNFRIIVDTSIALSLYQSYRNTSFQVILKVEPHLSESTFIQYNCARLKALIARYRTEFTVNQNEDSLDLSLLTNDLEWSLIFNHFSNYLAFISSFDCYLQSEDKQKSFSVYQLVLFLKGFVSEVSVYYKKVKVLTEPSPHLLSLIAVRIYFCKLSLNLILKCLDILGLDSVEKL